MTAVNLGRIGFNARGVWSQQETYDRLDTVAWRGACWCALRTVTGVTPVDDGISWRLMMENDGLAERIEELDERLIGAEEAADNFEYTESVLQPESLVEYAWSSDKNADSYIAGYTLTRNTGVPSANAAYFITPYVPVEEGKSYTFFTEDADGVIACGYLSRICAYSAKGVTAAVNSTCVLGAQAGSAGAVTMFTVPAGKGINYIRAAGTNPEVPFVKALFCLSPAAIPDYLPSFGEKKRTVRLKQCDYVPLENLGDITPYKANEEAFLARVLSDRDRNTVSFGVITDPHYSASKKGQTLKQVRALNRLAEKAGCGFVAALGDLTGADEEGLLADYWAAQHDTFLPVLYTPSHAEMSAEAQDESLGAWGFDTKNLEVMESFSATSWMVRLRGTRIIGVAAGGEQPGAPSELDEEWVCGLIAEHSGNIILLSHMDLAGNAAISRAVAANPSARVVYIHGGAHADSLAPGGSPDIGLMSAYPEGRPQGTYQEYCVNIVNAHADGRVSVFRFGAGEDIHADA